MKTKFIYFIVILIITLFSSCSKDAENISDLNPISAQLRSGRTAGRSQALVDFSQTRSKGRYNNPYYIGTIRAAYNKLKSEGKISVSYNIVPNALYIRYLPKNENELYQLGTTPNIELSEYPLQENDQNNLEQNHYSDGTLSDLQLPFQYTVCGIGQILSNYETDILDTLFLNHLTHIISDVDWKKIELEVFISTGVVDPNNLNDVQDIIFCDEWHPSGKIEIWDDAQNANIPLKRAKIKASKWYMSQSTFTDDNGNFRHQEFCGPVKYSIIWENGIWDIRDGNLGQADTQGPKQKAPWNHVILNDKKSLGFGTVHRSLVRYSYENIEGLKRPEAAASQIKVSYMHEAGYVNGFFASSGFEGLVYSHIHIYGLQPNGLLKETQSIFSTTIHELAHLTHAYQISLVQFWQVSRLIKESWARACAWKITELEYGYSPYPVPGFIQNWFFNQDPALNNYSPLFIDLEDNFNQNPTNISVKPRDLTSGYNLSLIQSNVLGHSYGLSSLRDRLKSQKPSGVTDTQIDANFQHYFENF